MAQELVEVLVEKQDALHLLQKLEQVLAPQRLEEFLVVGPSHILRERADARFASEGDSASRKWAPLRFSTEEIREAKGFPRAHPINERTGEMHNFLSNSVGVAVSEPGVATLTWPNDAAGELFDKLETAQRGRKSPSTVKRPVIAMDEGDAVLMLESLTKWFVDSMAGVYGD